MVPTHLSELAALRARELQADAASSRRSYLLRRVLRWERRAEAAHRRARQSRERLV
jgi:hypothetical protein